MEKINIVNNGKNITVQHGKNLKDRTKVSKTSFRIDMASGRDMAVYLDGALKFLSNSVTVQDGPAGVPVQLTPDNFDGLTDGLIESAGRAGGSAAPDASGWARPADRPPVPAFAEGEQAVCWLFGVQEHGPNDYAFLMATGTSGSYAVDWGDGTVETAATNTVCEHAYDFASLSKPAGSEGYKWVWIRATPADGFHITALNISQYRPSWRPAGNGSCFFIPQVFEIYIRAGEMSSLPFSVDYHTRHYLCDVFDFGGNNKITNLQAFCAYFYSLKKLRIHTGQVTNFQQFLYQCYSFNQPLDIDTGKGNLFGSFLYQCYSYNRPLAFMPKGSSLNNFCLNNSAYNGKRTFDFSTVTNVTGFLGNNHAMTGLRLLNMGSAISALSLQNSSMDADALMELCDDLYDRSAATAGTLTVTGTPASAQLTPTQKAMFTAKNWTLVL